MSEHSIPVVETFHSLQGEGAHTGRSAFFIRLAGCSVGCPWCDTKNSWNADNHPRREIEDLTREAWQAYQAGAGFVVITGGEPLEHDLTKLCERLSANRAPVHLETSGTAPWSGTFDWVTLSPKRHHPPTNDSIARCDELKIVVNNEADLAFAIGIAEMAKSRREGKSQETVLMLQPGWGNKHASELAINFVSHHREWRLSLQTHKWLGVK